MTLSLKKQFVFAPPNLGVSRSSLSARTITLGLGTGVLNITEVSFILKRPPSSLNFKIYSPFLIFGTTASVTLPDSLSSVIAFLKLPPPVGLLEALTSTVPPCVTSTSGEASNFNLTKWSSKVSTDKFCTSDGRAVFPTAINSTSAVSLLNLFKAL